MTEIIYAKTEENIPLMINLDGMLEMDGLKRITEEEYEQLKKDLTKL